ncbi:MAG: hypothetical protein WBN95_05640, partial [Gammaproteobacteria bacterium]
MTKSEKTLWAFLLYASITLLTACSNGKYSTAAQPVEGMITHYETGEPIPDAFVVARWTGTSGGLGHGGGAICFHVEVTKTDGAGRYYIPVPEIRPEYANYRKPRILITAYKPGYREPYWVNDVPAPSDELIVIQESPQERIEYLTDVRKNTTCMQAGKSEQNLLEISKALYIEIDEIAVSKDEKIKALSFLKDVEELELDDG